MPLVTVVIYLVLIGVVMWVINRYIPMASTIKSILNIFVAVVVVIWLLQVMGIWTGLPHLRVGA